MKMLKKNSVFLGVVLALLAPIASYTIIWYLNRGFEIWANDGDRILKHETILMGSIFLNLIIFIPYLKLDRYERTGRGVLLVTFVGVVVLFLTMFT